MSYRIIVKRQDKKDIVRTGVDKLNAVIIPAELKMAYPKSFQNGSMSVKVEEE